MQRIAVFPGSFDPITLGHESVITRALPLFDSIIIAIGENSEKKGYFPIEKRLEWIRKTFEKFPQITVQSYTGLTVDFCKKVNAAFILRGLRTSADFEFERGIGQMNKNISGIETVFLLSEPEHTSLSSSIIREIHKYGGDIAAFVPDAVINAK